jgi:hypothetical protein
MEKCVTAVSYACSKRLFHGTLRQLLSERLTRAEKNADALESV